MNNKNKKTEGSGKKRQFILFGISSFVAMAICITTLVITVKNIEGEGSGAVNSTVNVESKTQLTESSLTDYIYNLTSTATGNDFVKVNSYTDVNINDENIVVTDKNGNVNDKDKNIFAYAKNYFMPLADAIYGEDVTGVFGKNTGIKPLVEFSAEDALISSFSVGQVDENGDNILNDDGTVVDGDFYYITYEIDGKDVLTQSQKATFGVEDLTEEIASVKEKIVSYCQITSVNVTPEKFFINAKVNRLTDEIEYIEIQRNYTVKGDYYFIGDLGVFGEKQIEFPYTVTQRFEYFYAGIDIGEGEITLSEGKEAAVTVNAVIEDYSDYTVRFISSDESIATVDEMGYVTGVKTSEKSVTITVELEYLGKIFTDECTVYVTDGKEAQEVVQ